MKNDLNKLPTFKKLILDELKADGHLNIVKKIKSIRYQSFSMGNAVDVSSIDLNKIERRTLEKVLAGYKSGYFDSMQDLYVYGKSSKVRSAKYVSLHNEFSQDVKDRVKKGLEERGVTDYKSAWDKCGCDYETAVYRNLVELEDI